MKRKKKLKLFDTKYLLVSVGAVAVMVADVAGLVFMIPSRFSPASYISLFLLVLSAALTILIALGMLHSRFHLNQAEEAVSSAAFQPDMEGEGICGAIMSAAAGIVPVAGFLFHAWHPARIVFPLGAFCGASCPLSGNTDCPLPDCPLISRERRGILKR